MDYDEEAFREILDVMDGKEGEVVSTALIRKSTDYDTQEIQDAIKQLIVLGELTLIYAQQSGRVILNKSVHPHRGGQMTLNAVERVWRCYVAEDYQHRYHSGLFNEKGDAKEFLRTRMGDSVSDFEAVPAVENVYATQIHGFDSYGSHTAVIRGERINQQLSLTE